VRDEFVTHISGTTSCALVDFPAALCRSECGQPIVAGPAVDKLRRGAIVGKIANPTK
jgi:hypothetical protein